MKRMIAALFVLFPAIACAQGTPIQGGPWTPGHVPQYVGQGSSQPVIMDGGGAGGGATGVNVSELGIAARGTGTPPYAGQGTGPYGTNFCDYDAPTNNPTGYHFLCLSANAQGGGLLTYGSGGIASQLPLSFNVNGSVYPFPFAIGGIVGPSTSVIGSVPAWAGVGGNVLNDPQLLSLVPSRVDAPSGNAPIIATPTASDQHTVGIFVRPTIGTLSNPNQFYTPYNFKLGDTGSPIPFGTRANLGGYECNINTAQASADATSGGDHCFGGTATLTGGVDFQGLAFTASISNVAANVFGVNVNLAKNVVGGQAVGAFINADVAGTQTPDDGIVIAGSWAIGINLIGNNIRALSNIGFATTAGANTPYFIDGSQSDALRVVGGNAGVYLYGAQGTGTSGRIQILNNPADNVTSAYIDTLDGSIVMSRGSAIPANATGNYLYVPFSTAGSPTAIPSNQAEGTAVVYDTSADKLWARNNQTNLWQSLGTIGTSGGHVPLLNAANTFSGAQTFSAQQTLGAHSGSTGTAPGVSSCGTSPSVRSASTDNAGDVTTGTGTPTSCTITFATAYASTPFCVATDRTGTALSGLTISTTALTFSTSAVSSHTIAWQCSGI